MILVLPPDVPEALLTDVVDTVGRLGWTAQVSRGSEQTIVALEGSGDPFEVEQALEGKVEVDLIPVLSTQQ